MCFCLVKHSNTCSSGNSIVPSILNIPIPLLSAFDLVVSCQEHCFGTLGERDILGELIADEILQIGKVIKSENATTTDTTYTGNNNNININNNNINIEPDTTPVPKRRKKDYPAQEYTHKKSDTLTRVSRAPECDPLHVFPSYQEDITIGRGVYRCM
eukprot:GHVR01151628.1.p2 GENE.GHVR01151628.1~~GHVR01151628.1.p2  ORF type:complete len:157 (+),score=44.41 GHVR01151628.1:2417-2887(+)